ncbi:hypothetical protein [Actinacidiphila sp. ITFR-21]|uniref:hypothetical protein n=1 Tax=Actinacidiphila sp. ITFR-21 TaxID=3075199 RepID=UPI00288A551C|nr:hypothetical protein [Streptomyces sp. ITFR-21]WNI14692.1 hypothetical protein RLT57_03440 [Streptomyces sp. ITFR-21]
MAPANASPTPTRPLGTFPLRGVVPYITAWSSEETLRTTLTAHRNRLGYEGEHPLDRDKFGILWRRIGISPGVGTPEYGAVHSLRQRRTMLRTLCQVCGGPADQTRDGVLWLMGRAEYERAPWPAPIESPHPPVCLNCAVQAIRLCPHLRDHYIAVRVRRFHLSGVYGALYVPTLPEPRATTVETLALSDRRTAWLQASQFIMRLVDYRVVDLDAEAAAQGKER